LHQFEGPAHGAWWAEQTYLLSLSNRLMMQENKENPNELLELLLEKCDRLYQENMLLKGKLEDRTDVDALKTSYEQTISKKDVLPLGCWAHARRKFEESLKNDRERAEYALEQIGLLYEVEREADDKNLSYKTAMTSITV
jgi:hypothetical protein